MDLKTDQFIKYGKWSEFRKTRKLDIITFQNHWCAVKGYECNAFIIDK